MKRALLALAEMGTFRPEKPATTVITTRRTHARHCVSHPHAAMVSCSRRWAKLVMTVILMRRMRAMRRANLRYVATELEAMAKAAMMAIRKTTMLVLPIACVAYRRFPWEMVLPA